MGVAFLGGLALALLLVPINKVIANRIMESNAEMLEHKDARVKLGTLRQLFHSCLELLKYLSS